MPTGPETIDCILRAPAALINHHTLITDAAVAIQNTKIAAVGQWSAIPAAFAALPVTHLPGQILTPGLINAHTHLELGFLRGRMNRPMPFPDWVCQLFEFYPPPEQLVAVLGAAVAAGITECVAAGVTAVGDITRCPEITRPVLAHAPLRGVSFGEITAMGKNRHLLESRLAAARKNWSDAGAPGGIALGLSPHAPYSVEGPALARIVQCAAAEGLPLAMHLAELPDEVAFLKEFSGPLGRNWALRRKLATLDDQIPTCDLGPIAWARHWHLFDAPSVLLAHVNYANEADISELAKHRGVSVVFCPRTRRYFGHHKIGPHRADQMLAAGINICIGTDSLASAPDLNLLAEAACAHEDFPHLSFATLFRMLTEFPAAALNLNAGCIAPGLEADLAAFPLDFTPANAEAAAAQLISHHRGASGVMIGSRPIFGTLS